MKDTHSSAVTEDLVAESNYKSDAALDQDYSPEYDSELSTMPEGIECSDDFSYDIGMSQDDDSEDDSGDDDSEAMQESYEEPELDHNYNMIQSSALAICIAPSIIFSLMAIA